MSLDEYNRHSTLGPMAGPATSASAMAGQAAWQRNNQPPAQAGAAVPRPTVQASLAMLGTFAVAFAASLACAFVLPGSLATVASFAALVSGLGLVILGIHLGIEGAKSGLGWLLESAVEHGWGWGVGAGFVAFVFADLHWYAFGFFPAWMVAIVAACLALAARAAPALRPAAAAIGVGVVSYVLVASHAVGRHSLVALAVALAAAAAIAGAWQAWRTLRARKRSGRQSA